MAGMSSRFLAAGYKAPKHHLTAFDKTLFFYAIAGFVKLFKTEKFLFICRGTESEREFVVTECRLAGLVNVAVVLLDQPTDGQAHTVLLGLEKLCVPDCEPITIFNIDSFRLDFDHPAYSDTTSYIECFLGDGNHWSFASVDDNMRVIQTAEKIRISPYCSNGLYHFRSCGDFKWAYRNPPQANGTAESRERYVAPLYRALISRGDTVKCRLIENEKTVFCGTPSEYEAFLNNEATARYIDSVLKHTANALE